MWTLNKPFSICSVGKSRRAPVAPIARLWQKGMVPFGASMLSSTLFMGALALSTAAAEASEFRPERPPTPAMSLENAGAMSIWTNPSSIGFDPDPSSAFFYAWSPDGSSAGPRVFTLAGSGGPLGLAEVAIA